MAISAKIIADSLSEQNHRITTMVLVFPRIVLSEFNTHRMLSRNSASSRAIPFKKMLEMAKTDPFIPIRWMKEHTGMQGTEYLSFPAVGYCEEKWLEARDEAVRCSEYLSNTEGVSKQICNRLLEPFLYHTVICTATEWENFFALRAHPAAEIHIADLAQKMLDVYNESEPKQLKPGEWHLPFGDNVLIPGTRGIEYNTELALKIATARCARVSYGTFEGKNDYEADIKLHDRLAASGHFSPFEHCCRAMYDDEYRYYFTKQKAQRVPHSDGHHHLEATEQLGWCGNYRGFIQYRKLFDNENLKDPRVKSWKI